MIQHLCLIRYKDPDAVDAATQEKVEQIYRDFTKLVDGLTRMDVGADLSLLDGNSHLAIRADFDSEAAFKAYSAHPAHETTLFPVLGPHLDSWTTAQFKVSETADARFHVSVDPDLCQGHSVCMAEAPEIFDVREVEGRSYPLSHVLQEEIGIDLLEKARNAERYCPNQAILIRKMEKENKATVRHLCLIRYKDPDAVDAATQEKVEQIYRDFARLVDGLTRMDVGADLGLLDGNSHLAIRADFDSEAAFKAYSTHPAHETILFPVLGSHLDSWTTAQFRPS